MALNQRSCISSRRRSWSLTDLRTPIYTRPDGSVQAFGLRGSHCRPHSNTLVRISHLIAANFPNSAEIRVIRGLFDNGHVHKLPNKHFNEASTFYEHLKVDRLLIFKLKIFNRRRSQNSLNSQLEVLTRKQCKTPNFYFE